MDDLPLDTWELNHIEARSAIAELPDDADFAAIRAREEAREKGPRPSVIRAIEARTSEPAEGSDDEPSAEEDVPELPDAPWTEHNWRGHRLYKCKFCRGFQTFEIGKMYDHAKRHHPQR